MRIAVVQRRPDDADDLRSLRSAVEQARTAGAEAVVVPCLPSLAREPELHARLRSLAGEDEPILDLVVPCPAGESPVPTRFGLAAFRTEDACLDADGDASGARAFVWQFTPESELQAEGLLEYAIAVSLHGPGLVVIVATGSKEEGWPAQGSAIVHVGEVLAEAGAGDEVLVADVPDPMFAPEPPGSMPVLPPILAQRRAAHQGRKIVPSWPADMS